ncbi:MAG: cytochrome c [Rhodocyclaceae bacterium]|jgi:cytochrome c556|nr:cytochrome c [Rhodocyclaceae bacterium]
MGKKVFLGALAAVFLNTAYAAPLKPEDQIRFRKAGYSFMAWNMGRIKSNLESGYNKDEVVKSAAAVAAVSNSGLIALFGPGTEHDIGETKTRVKAEFFQQQDKVKELATAFNKEANELARVVTVGDVGAVKAQFGKTGEACKSCHDKFRTD